MRGVLMESVANNAERPPLPEGVLCPDCGYDLRGSTSERCSECGFVLDELRRAESQIPWTYRHKLGRFQAYWKTVWLVLRRPKRFCMEMLRPVSYRDSQSFRWLTMAHAYAAILIGSVAVAIGGQEHGWWTGRLSWWVVGGVQTWALSGLALLPGLASYFFQPRHLSVEQQNRAIALSYYAGAPLACLPAVLPFVIVGMATCTAPVGAHTILLGVLSAALPIALIGLAESRLKLLTRRVLHRPRVRCFLRIALLDVLGGLLVLLLAVLSFSFFWMLVVLESFR